MRRYNLQAHQKIALQGDASSLLISSPFGLEFAPCLMRSVAGELRARSLSISHSGYVVLSLMSV